MRFPCAIPCSLLLVACQGPSRLPEEYESTLPPERALAAEVRAAAAEEAELALREALAGKFGEARSRAEKALAVDPRLAIGRVVLARCLMQEAQRENPPTLALWHHAEGELAIARRLSPERAEVHLARADFFRADGHLSAAADALDDGLARLPLDRGLLRAAARLRYELGEERAAGALLGRLGAETADDPELLWMLAQVRARLAGALERSAPEEHAKGLRDAADTFRRYVKLVPDDPEGWLGEAWARAALGAKEAEASLALYEKAASLRERSPEPHFGRGVALETLGRSEEARAAYRAALVRDDRHVGALLNLAANLAKGKPEEVEQARELARRLLTLRLSAQERQGVEKFLATRP